MTTSRSLRTSLIVLSTAWLMAVPAYYLLYDFWMHGMDRAVREGALLRPYAFFVGLCPLALFWAGSAFATLSGLRAARHARGASRALHLLVITLGGVGSLAGTAFGAPLLAVTLLGLGRGDVPLGLLLLLGGLSAAAIWLLRSALRWLDSARAA